MLAVAWLLPACNSVGFHEDGKVDFARYRVVSVEPFAVSSRYADASPAPASSRSYLVGELERLGGFESVTGGDPSADLFVEVDVTRVSVEHGSSASIDCCDVTGFLVASVFDLSCEDPYVTVEVTVDMRAWDADGEQVYSLRRANGVSEPVECASSQELRDAYAEALDDALDEIAVFFLRGFDI